MPESIRQDIHVLNERIRLLEDENSRLATQAEDLLLLGLIHGAISPLHDCDQILAESLKRISLLKDIPCCCCGTLEHDSLTICASNLSFSHDNLTGQQISLNGHFGQLQELSLLDSEACLDIKLPLADCFHANEILLIPFGCRYLPNGMFLFACDSDDGTQLQVSLAMLQRVSEVITLAMDHVQVIAELENINATLDQRVEQRTSQLRESEAQYRSLIDQAMDGIFVFDPKDGCFLDVNASACRALAYSRDELLRLTVSDIVEDRPKEVFDKEMELLHRDGTAIIDGVHKRHDGTTYPVETHMGMILLKGKVSVLAVSHDISARKESEMRLNRAHALLQSLLNGIPDLIFFKNPEGIYLGCNRAFCEFVGKCEQDEIVGLTDCDLFDTDMADFCRQKSQSMLAKGKPQRNEEWVRYPDGREVLLDTLKTPYFSPEGESLGLIGISRDITEQRHTEEQLLQAQKMEGIGTLVGGIAHDFNNMLAGLMGNLYLIGHDVSLSSEGRAKVERMNELCERATSMIAQLLTFSRKGMVRMQAVDFSCFLHEALDLAELAIPENIQVIHTFDVDDTLTVMGDQVQLQQLVLNLLVNARDAVKSVTDPCIRIGLQRIGTQARLHECHQGLAEGPWLELSVSDNGCGIPESIRDQLFEPFFTTKEVGEGTGLGLSTVYGVVQSHQGAIQIDSREHESTTFRVYLSLHGEQAVPVGNSPEALPRGHGETVLLVDDEDIVLTTTSALLTHLGYRLITAHTGLQALEKDGLDTVDVALLDVVMPEMGGVETAKRLRIINPKLPVIFATAYDRKKVLTKQDQLPNSWILSKPFRLQLLATILKNSLQQR